MMHPFGGSIGLFGLALVLSCGSGAFAFAAFVAADDEYDVDDLGCLDCCELSGD